MFKMGDDLRQDQLTLQILTVMNDLWRQTENGSLNFHVSNYGCISTGDEMGFLEMVPNAETLASIVKSSVKEVIGEEKTLKHRVMSALAALNDATVIRRWLSNQVARHDQQTARAGFLL